MVEQIGIILWGCKGGCRVFCHNGVVNPEDADIQQTLKDIRSFIQVGRPRLTTYALEFTARHKVYTQYCSSSDQGPAFLAITLYVPHRVRHEGLRALLGTMMTGYRRTYVDLLSGAPRPCLRETIEPLQRLLDESAPEVVADPPRFRHVTSRQDDTPHLLLFDTPATVDEYFASPYRPEFFACQEVMFMERKAYSQPEEFNIQFLPPDVPPHVITSVSEPEPLSQLAPYAETGCTLALLTIDGEAVRSWDKPVTLCDDSPLTLRIEAPYADPVTFEGSASEAEQQHILVRRGRDYAFRPGLRPKPKTYFIRLVNKGVETKLLAGALNLVDQTRPRTIALTSQGKDYGYALTGEEVAHQYALRYKNYEADLALLCPEEQPDVVLTTHIETYKLHFAYDSDKPTHFTLTFDGHKWNIKEWKKEVTVILPREEGFSLERVAVEADDFNCHTEGDVFVFTPQHETATLDLPPAIRRALKEKVSLQLDDESYYPDAQMNLRMPYGWKKRADEATLYIGTTRLPLTLNADGHIAPRFTFLRNPEKEAITIKVDGRVTSVDAGGYLLLTPEAEVAVADDHTVIDDQGAYTGSQITEKTLRIKSAPQVKPTEEEKKAAPPVKPAEEEKKPAPKVTPKYTARCKGCTKWNIRPKDKNTTKNAKDRVYDVTSADRFDLFGEYNNEVCTVFFPSTNPDNLFAEKKNEHYGFQVDWDDENTCTITYEEKKKNSFFGRFIN